jgi:hypothetical protein
VEWFLEWTDFICSPAGTYSISLALHSLCLLFGVSLFSMIHWCPFFVESPCRYTTRGEVAWIGGLIGRALAYSKHSTVDSALQRDESNRCGVACPDIRPCLSSTLHMLWRTRVSGKPRPYQEAPPLTALARFEAVKVKEALNACKF